MLKRVNQSNLTYSQDLPWTSGELNFLKFFYFKSKLAEDTSFEDRALKLAVRDRLRKQRLLDEFQRTLGLDIATLESQVKYKSDRLADEKDSLNSERMKMLEAAAMDDQVLIESRYKKAQEQKALGEELLRQAAEKEKRDKKWKTVETHADSASVHYFTVHDRDERLKIAEKRKEQAEWLGQQIYERKLLEKTETEREIPQPGSTARVNRAQIRKSIEEFNRKQADEKAAGVIPSKEASLTSLPESRYTAKETDFKGVSREIVRSEIIQSNKALEMIKKEKKQRERENEKRFQMESEKTLLQANEDFLKEEELRRLRLIESLRISRENENIRRKKQEETDAAERGLDSSIFFNKRFGNSLTCMQYGVNYSSILNFIAVKSVDEEVVYVCDQSDVPSRDLKFVRYYYEVFSGAIRNIFRKASKFFHQSLSRTAVEGDDIGLELGKRT